MFVLPVLIYTLPDAARDALRWRHSTLDKARDRAKVLGLKGAAFPWRSINGAECSAYWPAGTAAFHVSGDVAYATQQYLNATNDECFDRDEATEILVETARLWLSLGHHDPHDGFRIDGVTGPDQYSAIVDNNVYTNLIAQQNLWAAADAAERNPSDATQEEIDSWRRAADAMAIPYDEMLQVHPQADNFTKHAEWDFENTPEEKYPLLLHFPYFDLYRRQVVKQADLVLAMHVRGDAFTAVEKARNFAYFEARTVRDSSLSAGTQAVLAAEVGHLDLAFDYLVEAVFTDLHDLHDNVNNGLHMASLAGAWMALVAGFGGMRDHGGELTFAPRLPASLTRFSFRMAFQGTRISIDVCETEATYRIVDGTELKTRHHGEPITITVDEPVTMPIPKAPELERPKSPFGREPRRR
jgi:alpha,alpha-trehalose phosphorylase